MTLSPRKRAAAALLLGAGLRFLFLGAKSLWFDEASTLLLSSLPLADLPSALVRNELNPPLYYALMHVWLKAFADPRIGLRVFSALCGVASLFAFRALANRLLPDRAREPALWLAAASSFWIHAAQDGRAYAWILLLGLGTTLLALELASKPRARLWAAYAALAALGLWSHYYFAILLAGHAAWLALETKDRRGLLLAHAAAALAFLPWLGFLASQLRAHVHDPVLGEALTAARALDLLGSPLFDPGFLGLALPAWTGVAVGAAFLALALRARGEDGRAFKFCATHAAAALAVVAAAEIWSGRPVTQARYFTPLSPVLLLLAALGAGRGWRMAFLGAVAFAGTACYFFSALMVDPRLDLLAASIRRSSAAGVPVVHLGKYYYLPLRVYYLPERRNLLLARDAVGMDFRAMAPYSGVIEDKDLPGLGPCVVVDESRELSTDRVRIGTGAELAALLRR